MYSLNVFSVCTKRNNLFHDKLRARQSSCLQLVNANDEGKLYYYNHNARMLLFQSRRVQSADSLPNVKHHSRPIHSAPVHSLSSEEIRMVRYARAQFERRGGFIRIFPSAESWKRYSAYLGTYLTFSKA